MLQKNVALAVDSLSPVIFDSCRGLTGLLGLSRELCDSWTEIYQFDSIREKRRQAGFFQLDTPDFCLKHTLLCYEKIMKSGYEVRTMWEDFKPASFNPLIH